MSLLLELCLLSPSVPGGCGDSRGSGLAKGQGWDGHVSQGLQGPWPGPLLPSSLLWDKETLLSWAYLSTLPPSVSICAGLVASSGLCLVARKHRVCASRTSFTAGWEM